MSSVLARARRPLAALTASVLALAGALVVQQAASAADETTYTLVGDLQSEIGCPTDWDPACTAGDLDPVDGSAGHYATTVTLPAGSYAFKVVADHAWGTAYGFAGSSDAGAANIPLVE